jgi:hypothetical protein
VLLKATEIPFGLFAFGQVRRLNGLAGVESVFERDDFGSDVTTGGLGLLKNLVGGESGQNTVVGGNEYSQADAGDLRPGIDEGDRFHSGTKSAYRRRTL